MNAYPDTSFLASLYVDDVHAPKADGALRALRLLVFRGLITAARAGKSYE